MPFQKLLAIYGLSIPLRSRLELHFKLFGTSLYTFIYPDQLLPSNAVIIYLLKYYNVNPSPHIQPVRSINGNLKIWLRFG